MKIIGHKLAKSDLSIVRSKKTNIKNFREAVERLTIYLLIEASSAFPMRITEIETPLELTKGSLIKDDEIVLIPILRAGLWMVKPVVNFLCGSKVYPIGIKRNEETLEPDVYYSYLPDDFKDKLVIVLDPMLATGGSIISTLNETFSKNPMKVLVLSILTAPEGLKEIESKFPDVELFSIALDRKLNSIGYILPGLGDAGDRLFG